MSDLHIASQQTKKYNLPLTHLEYSYIEKCSDVKELEKILKVLRSGEEGRYPDLESFTEKRLERLCPKSRALRKDAPISRPSDLGSGDWKTIEQDLKDWSNEMNTRDNLKTGKQMKVQTELCEGDENLPPVRCSNIVIEGKKRKEEKTSKNIKKIAPREYRDWDKLDVDEELRKADDNEEKKSISKRSTVKGVTDKIDVTGLSEEEKEMKADREKDKGNEAYRSGDYEESITYYSRSISLLPTSASYNNRALAYLKLEKWEKAIKDCNTVLNLEKDNVKALLRRGTAYKSKNQLCKGKADFERVLALEPNNKRAESLLQDVDDELQQQAKSRKEKGRRMVIEEVNDSEDNDEEEIEVEKPMINGYGHHHVKENGGVEPDRNVRDLNHKDDSNKESKNIFSEDKESFHGKLKSNTATPDHSFKADQKPQECTPKSPAEKEAKESSHNISNKLTKDMCSKIDAEETTTSNLPVLDKDSLSAFHEGNSIQQPAAAFKSDQASAVSPSSSSGASSTYEHSHPQSSSIAETKSSDSSVSSHSSTVSSMAAQSSSSSTTVKPVPSEPPQSFSRPVLLQLPLPEKVLKLKAAGNDLFKSGQYSAALHVYSQAIAQLEKDADHKVNTSLILSNRAACHLKTGNCSEVVSDCEKSLRLVPHMLKSVLRRAAAYETLEKYGQAYVGYKHALSIDNSVDQASQGASRCQKILSELHGQRCWREKIPPLILVQPWEIPIIQDQSSPSSQITSSVPVTPQSEIVEKKEVSSGPSEKDTSSVKSKEPSGPSKEEQFEKLKAEGNSHVQKGAFQEAEKCYSSCIDLCPEQVACYTNRALCYIKLNKATEAESDCDKALSLQPDNPKALYRRALARKMLQRYKLSMQDLLELLKLEPKNKAASSEMEIVKQYYKEELKQKKQESDGKVRKRMKIEEVDDEEEDEKHGRSKAQVKSQSKQRGGKASQGPSVVKSKSSNQTVSEKKQNGTDNVVSGQGIPVAPPSAPRLMKTTPYEFCQAWNSLKPNQGIQPYAEILRQVSPPDLPSVISNKLDGQMLQIIVRCVYEEMVLKGEMDKGYQILDNLRKVPRFSTVSMFMSTKEKKEVSSVLDILSKTGSSAYSKADVLHLKKEYSVK